MPRQAAPAPATAPATAPPPSLRLDLWLWHARVCSTRAACAALIERQGVRINGRSTDKPASRVRPQDVLTFAVGPRVRVLRVLALGDRRGPPEAARALFHDLGADA